MFKNSWTFFFPKKSNFLDPGVDSLVIVTLGMVQFASVIRFSFPVIDLESFRFETEERLRTKLRLLYLQNNQKELNNPEQHSPQKISLRVILVN